MRPYGHGAAEADPVTGPSPLQEPDGPDQGGYDLASITHAIFSGSRFAIVCRGRKARRARAPSSIPGDRKRPVPTVPRTSVCSWPLMFSLLFASAYFDPRYQGVLSTYCSRDSRSLPSDRNEQIHQEPLHVLAGRRTESERRHRDSPSADLEMFGEI